MKSLSRCFLPLALVLFGPCSSVETQAADTMKQVTVFKEDGRFGGWPANFGIWSWDNEILVGFARGWYKNLGNRHHIDRDRPEEHLFARSLDGGETWVIENPSEKGYLIPQGGSLHGIQPPWLEAPPATDCPGGVNFTHPDFAMTLRMNDVDAGQCRFFVSYDRGHNWQGPWNLPHFGNQGTAARTDYIVEDQDSCLMFSTASKADGDEGRPFCARTDDGGKTWEWVSWIMEEPTGFGIMPSTVRLGDNELLSIIRRREPGKRWNEAYYSADNGKTWTFRSNPVESLGEGNPASAIRLKDGRILTTNGNRQEPFNIEARISADNGVTWGEPIVLRGNGGGRDIGYPRTIQRPDGMVVTTYYWHDDPNTERYIGGTIWDPSKF